MAFNDLAPNQMVDENNASTGGFVSIGPKNPGNQMYTKQQALSAYSLVASPYMDSYASNQLVPKSVWHAPAGNYDYKFSFGSNPNEACSTAYDVVLYLNYYTSYFADLDWDYWDSDTNPATNYILYKDSGSGPLIIAQGASLTDYIDESVTPNHSYVYHLEITTQLGPTLQSNRVYFMVPVRETVDVAYEPQPPVSPALARGFLSFANFRVGDFVTWTCDIDQSRVGYIETAFLYNAPTGPNPVNLLTQSSGSFTVAATSFSMSTDIGRITNESGFGSAQISFYLNGVYSLGPASVIYLNISS